MAPRRLIMVAVGLVLAGYAAYRLSGTDTAAAGTQATSAPATQLAAQAKTGWQIPAAGGVAAPKAAIKDSPLLPMSAYEPAATSMANTREHGDARTPPIERTPEREAPDTWTMADPDRYAQYEAGQNAKIYGQYVNAADAELPKLRAAIEAARSQGMPPEQIAVGEEKLRQLQAARDMAANLLQTQSRKP